jgi:hypothetical protein
VTDPRGALRAQRARWLLVRNNLRAVAARLAAADHALRRDARRSDDPEMHVLVDALAAQRRCFGEVAVDLDERIAVIEEELRELELAVVQKVVRIAQCARVRFSSRMP